MGKSRGIAGIAALALGIAGALITTTPAAAAVCIVSNNGNGSAVPGTLAFALAENNAGNCDGIIQFSINGTIPAVAEDLPDITEDLAFIGNGSTNTTVQGLGDVLVITGAIVAITGVNLTGAAATSGIVASNATLTLDDVNADDFSNDGIRVTNSSFVADDVRASFNGDDGIEFNGSTVADTLGLSEVVASFNAASGVHVLSVDSTVNADDVFVEQNDAEGIRIETTGSVLTASALVALTNETVGVYIIMDESSSGTVTGGRAAENDQLGYVFETRNGSSVTGSDLHAFDNVLAGINALSFAGTTIDLVRVEADHNHVDGVWLNSESGSVSLQDSHSHANGTDLPGSGVRVSAVVTPSGTSTVRISGSTIENNTNALVGGGIYVVNLEDSALQVSGTTIQNNGAVRDDEGDGGQGGGVFVDLFERSSLDITDSDILNNDAEDAGAGIFLNDVGGGEATGPVTIARTSIDGNTVTGVDGVGGGIVVADFSHRADGGPVVLIDSSTISNNSATFFGGLIADRVLDDEADGAITVVDSTISGNTDAGAAIGDSAGEGAVLRLLHSTVTANDGDGVVVGPDATLELDHTILSGNGGDDLALEDDAELEAFWNIVQDPDAASAALLTAADHNRTGIDPKLGPLAENGGPTLTHLLLAGSPAINTGDPAFTGPPVLDQRGNPRIVAVVDIGAVEMPPALAATGSELQIGLWVAVALLLLVGGGVIVARRRSTEHRA